MVERIRELCREKGISILKLEMACGFSNGSVNKWSRQSPSADKLLTVASFFGVSMEYLLTGKQPTVTDGLSEEAIMTANIIDALPPERRRLLLALVQELASAPSDPASSAKSP